jgi:hypothetical protein
MWAMLVPFVVHFLHGEATFESYIAAIDCLICKVVSEVALQF